MAEKVINNEGDYFEKVLKMERDTIKEEDPNSLDEYDKEMRETFKDTEVEDIFKDE